MAEGADREFLSEEEKKQIEALGGWEKLMETLKERMEEQKKRHEGGNKMIGRAVRRPMGLMAIIPKACGSVRTRSATASAVKVWDKREYKNLGDPVESVPATSGCDPASAKMGARWRGVGLDMQGTIHETAKKGLS